MKIPGRWTGKRPTYHGVLHGFIMAILIEFVVVIIFLVSVKAC